MRKKTGAGLLRETGAAVCFGNAAQMRRGMQGMFACFREILETGAAGGYNVCKAMLDAGHFDFDEAW